MNTIKKAFTMIEIIMVIVIISILMLGMTIYFSGSQERSKIIEAEGCATAFLGELNSYIYNTLTSKSLKIGSNYVSPDYYYIQLTGANCQSEGGICNKILLGYSINNNNIKKYKELTPSNVCQNNAKIGFYGVGGTIKMNKGFIPKSITDKVFKIGNSAITGDIIVTYCKDNNCNGYKDILKREVDGRSQTIAQQKCVFYKSNKENKCDIRQNESIIQDEQDEEEEEEQEEQEEEEEEEQEEE